MLQKKYSAVELSRRIKSGEVTVEEAVEAVYAAIEEKEKECHAFLMIRDKDEVLNEARQLQKEIRAGRYKKSPIAGVPMALKDNLCVEGTKTTCASRMLENFEAPYTATAVKKLKTAGALFIGKTNMDEFSMGNTTKTSCFGYTKNPRNTEHVPGGSSGGSAAALAAEECWFSLGSETGGSVRQPAAHCGLVGIKPTYGTVSRYGLIAYASSLDQIGVFGKTVEDCGAVLATIAGWDEKDSTSVRREDYDFTADIGKDVRGMKLLLPLEYLADDIQPEIKEALLTAVEKMQAEGAEVTFAQIGMTEYLIPMYYSIVAAEASSNLARFDGVKYGYRVADAENLKEMTERSRTEGFGREVRRRLLLGTYVLSGEAYETCYLKALKAKEMLRSRFDEIFAEYDFILAPVAPTTAPRLDAQKSQVQGFLEDIFTVPANLTGIPAISVPAGVDKAGLPIGIQLMANRFEERKLLRGAYVLEQK